MYLHEEVIMLKKEDFAVIKALVENGVYQKDIAEKLGVHPKTVSRALKRGRAPGTARKKGSKLEPYKPIIDRLLSEGVWNAVVILREIQAEGLRRRNQPGTQVHPAQAGAAVEPGDSAVRDETRAADAKRLGREWWSRSAGRASEGAVHRE